jgi:hypothetical protein
LNLKIIVFTFQKNALKYNRIVNMEICMEKKQYQTPDCPIYIVGMTGQYMSKAYLLNSIAQRSKEILDKILPYLARAVFCPVFSSYLGHGVSRKIAFQIY